MFFKIKLLGLIFLLTGCASQSSYFIEPQKIIITGNTLVYDGVITGDAVLDAIRMVRLSDVQIDTLRITSPGGEIASGIEFGYYVKEKNWNVEISQLCFSACANYVLTAAKHVVIKKDALVGWHGGANQKDEIWKQSVKQQDQQEWLNYINRLRIKEAAFFDEIKVDPNITVYGQINRNRCQTSKNTDGWHYTEEDLHKMGVTSVDVQSGALVSSVEYNGSKINSCLMPSI